MAKQNNNSDLALNLPLGVTLSIGEVLFTVAIAAMVKFIANDISVFMILFFRYLLCIPLLLLAAENTSTDVERNPVLNIVTLPPVSPGNTGSLRTIKMN